LMFATIAKSIVVITGIVGSIVIIGAPRRP
jgi:hypothetical protein